MSISPHQPAYEPKAKTVPNRRSAKSVVSWQDSDTVVDGLDALYGEGPHDKRNASRLPGEVFRNRRPSGLTGQI